MGYSILCLLATCLALLPTTSGQQFPTQGATIGMRMIKKDSGTCSASDRENAINEFTDNATNIVQQLLNNECGGPGWRPVAFINMTDTSYNCPPGLVLTSYPKRTCERTSIVRDGCSSTTFNVGSQYSRVCGRIIGYMYGDTGAFAYTTPGIDNQYLDGVSLTHGAAGQRQHIWSFISGLSEYPGSGSQYCPCASTQQLFTPSFIGNNYFCESGWNIPYGRSAFQADDPLWDGENCPSGSTCCEFNIPPWFSKDLPNPTTDDIELRMCGHFGPDHASTPIELIELYVQ